MTRMKPFWSGVLGSIVGFMIMTGMSFFWQDVFTVDRSGVIDFRVSATGNIGIGMQGAMDSPGSRLVVKASGTGTTSSALDVQASDGTSRLFVRDDGNVGIGTTSPGQPHVINAPLGDTTVNIPSLLIRNTNITNSIVSAFTARSVSSGDMTDGFGNGWNFEIGDTAGVNNRIARIAGVRDGADNSGSITFMTVNEVMRLKPDGNVGIGTTVPTSKLHVVGLPLYANNAAAIAGGLTAGAFYRTGGDPDLVCVVH